MTKRRTCLICPDFHDTGEDLVGKFAYGVVERLIAQEDVDVLVTNSGRNSINGDPVISEKIHLQFISELYMPEVQGQDAVAIACKVYRYIRDARYETVHILLPNGAGAYCAMAKRQGLISSNIITYVIGGSETGRKKDNRFPEKADFLLEALERAQCEHSDFLVSIDQSNPPNIVPLQDSFHQVRIRQFWPIGTDHLTGEPLETKPLSRDSVNNLVILGDHAYSSGIDLIVQAIRRFPGNLRPDLTFIGNFGEIFGENSGGYIVRHLKAYRGRLSFLPPRGRREVSEVLQHANSLTIIPGRGRDSSWELAQSFGARVPFLAFGIVGLSDHIAAESLPFCSTEANPDSIMDAIAKAAVDGMPSIRAAYSTLEIERSWQSLIAAGRRDHSLPTVEDRPLVSVCLTHFERPALLQQALNALAQQTYDNVEVIVVDDGSKGSAALALLSDLEIQDYRFPLKVIRSCNRYLGTARNLAAEHAKGEYLLFHDDDNIAEPNEIETFVEAAIRSDADILTSLYWVFENVGETSPTDKRLLCHAVGIGGPISLLENRFGDANALVKRSTFKELGGFSTLYGVGYEDWEFFLKAYLRGHRLAVVPEPLFNYRVSGDSMVASSSHGAGLERVFHLLDEERCAFAGDLARLISKESMAYHTRTRLSEDLEGSEARSLHLRLAELPPNSDEVWKLLSEIAMIEGRLDDPAKLGVGNSQPDCATSSLRGGGIIHAELVHDAARPAVILMGWGISGDGAPISPTHFCLEGRVYEVCAIARQPRLDVNERFKISHEVSAGFCIAGRLLKGPKSWPYRFGRGRKTVSPRGKINIFWSGHDGVVAHIDQCFLAHEALIEPPSNWNGSLTLETVRPSFPFVKYGNGEYRLGLQKSRFQTRFSFVDDQQPAGLISVISPMDPNADLFFEIQG